MPTESVSPPGQHAKIFLYTGSSNQALPPYAKGGRLMITKAPCHY